MSSDVILERLMALHPKLIDLSLGRVETLLERLGNPERRAPSVIHIAGTNGKGSTLAFIRAILEASGLAVHAYTSPHLSRFHERIRLAGELISESDLAALLAECEDVNDGAPITFFEVTTVAAFLAFERTPADVLLLETGLGGRLDATNVIARPALTVITPVSIDHQQFLGETLEAIAGEKAGILKPGVPCVLAAQPAAARRTIADRAESLSAPLFEQDRDWSVRLEGQVMTYEGPRASWRLPRPNLLGAHQITNAGVAVAAIDRLRLSKPSAEIIGRGLSSAEWPARMQRLSAEALPAGWELWLDGGHNAAAAEVIADVVRDWATADTAPRPLHLICGMMNTKGHAEFFGPLAPLITASGGSLRCVAIPGEANSLAAEELAAAARSAGIEATPATSVSAALSEIGKTSTPARVLICGSLYLAGRVLASDDGADTNTNKR